MVALCQVQALNGWWEGGASENQGPLCAPLLLLAFFMLIPDYTSKSAVTDRQGNLSVEKSSHTS